MSVCLTTRREADGVMWIVFHREDGRANVLDRGTLGALDAAVAQALADSTVRGLVLTSDHDRIFLAGADLHEVAALATAAEAAALAREGKRIMARLAAAPVPVVAAIHGACAGGGAELALACHWRIATDARETRIGLPELALGTIPGWGGGVRLTRLLGADAALAHLLGAALLEVRTAAAQGWVDEVVPRAGLAAAAMAAVERQRRAGPPRRSAPVAVDVPAWSERQRAAIERRTRGLQSAPLAALAVVAHAASRPEEEAMACETEHFARLTPSAECRDSVRTFFLKEAARRPSLEGWFALPHAGGSTVAKTEKVRRVGVVGAGTMGAGIAYWAAVHGCEVVLRDVSADGLLRALATLRARCAESTRRGSLTADEAAAACARVRSTTQWEGFGACDLVVEAVVEDLAVKRAVWAELETHVPRDAVLASNTSALPIERLAGVLVDRGRAIGLHFFNPVHRMPLVEVVLGSETSLTTAEQALAWVLQLRKLPVLCRSAPGFIVTRTLFAYLEETLHLWEQVPATAAIDEAMLDFGWPMGPLRLMDEIGLDVTAAIIAEMNELLPGRFRGSPVPARLLGEERYGRKRFCGFYRYDAGGGGAVSGVVDPIPAAARAASLPSPDAIRQRLLGRMIAEAQAVLGEGVARSADDIDLALHLGAGFPAWRGGLVHWARASGLW
jgi:3-hydroxyacyl-CoA dehydrogenase/enoyl-CoA hydratase/3-hydroxybutyryl-CoA epimerase